MPANGTIPRAMLMRVVAPSSSHAMSEVIVSGSDERMSTSDVVNSTANSTPASAAARGDVSGRVCAAVGSGM